MIEIQEAGAGAAGVTDDALTVDLVDGRTIIVPLVWYPRLWNATPKERNHLVMLANGAYLHWPDLNEDLTVSGLLAGRRSGEGAESLKKWLKGRERTRNQIIPSRKLNKKYQGDKVNE